jgi:hypothetical protein
VHEEQRAVLAAAAGRLAPVEVLEPLDAGCGEPIEAAQPSDGAAELGFAVRLEEPTQPAIDRAPIPDPWKHHPHVTAETLLAGHRTVNAR